MSIRLLFSFLGLVFLSSCTSVKIAAKNHEFPAREVGCEVQVLTVPPADPFHEVALLEMGGDYTELSAYLPKLKEQACALGGDAILVSPIAVKSSYVWNRYGGATSSSGQGQATVIKFKSKK